MTATRQLNEIEKKHTSPLEGVSELFNFNSCKVDKALVSTSRWVRKSCTAPFVLVCHDMKGGYLDDKFIDGTDNPCFYNFYHWAQIDIFVYFSHHMVTIPPLMWLELAHKNGIPILGTFITEWDEGAEKCSLMFSTEESAIKTAEKLLEISRIFGFDGWLINIENPLSLTEVINVKIFLQILSTKSREYNANNYCIWYDSVTTEGKLHWQDGVTDLNFPFLDCCDGIFLNYCWKNWQLNLTMELCQDRLGDVFTGIDIWGRGCVGKFDSYKSAEEIRSYGLSIALFAPGWCYEVNDNDFNAFLSDNNKFWNLLLATCPPRPLTISGPEYTTNFNYGFGKYIFEYGFLLGEKSWFNLRKQDVPFVHFQADNTCKISINSNNGFEGSTSLLIEKLSDVVDTTATILCIDTFIQCGEVRIICKDVKGDSSGNFKLCLTNSRDACLSLNHDSLSDIGGNGWKCVSFKVHNADIKCIGIKSHLKTFSILFGQLIITNGDHDSKLR